MASIEIAVFEVDENAPPAEQALTRARYIMNALFAAYGDPERKPGTSTIVTTEVEAALVMALALLHSTEKGIVTRKDFREAAETVAKNVWKSAVVLRENLSDEDRASIGLSTTRLN